MRTTLLNSELSQPKDYIANVGWGICEKGGESPASLEFNHHFWREKERERCLHWVPKGNQEPAAHRKGKAFLAGVQEGAEPEVGWEEEEGQQQEKCQQRRSQTAIA